MGVVHDLALVVYALAVVLLAVYALHSLWLLVRFLRHRRAAAELAAREEARALPEDLPIDLPIVLVQLPVFNERDVVERLVEAAGRLRWPRDRLRIQLLDDSSDDSLAIGRAAIARLCAQGLTATCRQRLDRSGFKAGALSAGLAADALHTDGPASLVAIFDADFVPAPDFLERAAIPLLDDPGLALVQGRWEHLNRDASALTRAQALGIDGHFAIEQGARAWSGLAMNFNGTCGLWRRAAISDGGGWQHDTLTEDMDLSYRVQLAGWRCTYRLGLAVPGELPQTVSAWRAQQFRWAKGSIQTAIKLLPAVFRAPWPASRKLAAALHMTHYLVHPLILLSLIAAPLAMPALHRLSTPALAVGAVLFLFGVGAPLVLYGAAQFVLRGRGAASRLRELPILAAVGSGIAVSNTLAVWQALRGRTSEFVRTPKQGTRPQASYRATGARGVSELVCAAWAAFGAYLGLSGPRPWMGLLLILYCTGFAWVGVRLFIEGRSARDVWLRLSWEARPRSPPWLVPLGLASLAGYALLALQPGSWRDQPVLFAAVGAALGALYLVAVHVSHRVRSAPLGWIIVVALGMRLISLGLAPSDDVNRYIVEGAQVRAGENPYLVAPAQSALRDTLAQDVVAGVNHADWVAIYPPVTFAFEAVVTAVSESPAAFKMALMLVELLGLALVLALLVRLGLPPAGLLAAAWNPVGPLFGAGEGHHDFLMGTLIVLSLLLATSGRRTLALVSAALAALTKPFALVAIAAQAKLKSPRTWLVPALVALAVYAPFAAAGPAIFQSLGRFGSEMHFHGALEPLVRGLLGAFTSPPMTQTLTVLLLGLVWISASVLIWRRGRADGTSAATLTARLLAVLLVCLPTLHPWYLAPLVMLLPFVRTWSLVVWTAMAPIYWLHGLAFERGAWGELPWVTLLAHLPALALLIWEIGTPSAGGAAPAEPPKPSHDREGRALQAGVE